jgi:glucan phosphorylase
MRKFRVKASLKNPTNDRVRQTASDTVQMGLEREFKVLANDVHDAKVRAKALLVKEGYDDKMLQQATWTVSRLNYLHKDKLTTPRRA